MIQRRRHAPLIAPLLVAACASTLTFTAARAQVQDAPFEGAENVAATGEFTPALDRAVTRGLAALAAAQNPDGSWDGGSRYGRHVGITGLAALALMADGHLPGRGEYGDNVARALDFVLANSSEIGLLAAETSHGPMYGHGFAALFLGEIYGMTGGQMAPTSLPGV